MGKILKILHVVYGGTGGAARIVLDIARNHNRTIYEPIVVLVGYKVDEQYVQELEECGVKVEKAEKHKKWDFAFFKELRKIIAGYRPEVVLLHTPIAYFWGRAALIGLGVKLVISVEHVAIANYYGLLGRTANILLSHFFTDRVVCVSEAVKAVIKKELCLPDRKIQVIENGIPLERVPMVERESLLQEKPFKLKMVSRLDRQKDPETLIMAIKRLKEEGLEVQLDFIGDGDLSGDMASLCKRVGVDDIVSFLGRRSDVPSLLLETDLFILSTHVEGLPIALLEAMAAGLPCIATAVPGTLGVIDDQVNGLLVPENDVGALCQALLYLIENPEAARHLGEMARQKAVKSYSISQTVRKYEKIFESSFQLSSFSIGQELTINE